MLKTLTLIRVGLRSLFLEASWSYSGQQALGFAAAIDPALDEIYKNNGQEALVEARGRNRAFFNTNPITSGLAIGVAINLEEQISLGRMTAADRDRFLKGVTMLLASWGDGFFWQTWMPLCSLLSVLAVINFSSVWGALLLPVMFLAVAGPVRFGGLYFGYLKGASIFDVLERIKIPRWIRRMGLAVAMFVGIVTIVTVKADFEVYHVANPLIRLWGLVGTVVCSAVALRVLLAKIRRPEYWLYPLVTLWLILLYIIFIR